MTKSKEPEDNNEEIQRFKNLAKKKEDNFMSLPGNPQEGQEIQEGRKKVKILDNDDRNFLAFLMSSKIELEDMLESMRELLGQCEDSELQAMRADLEKGPCFPLNPNGFQVLGNMTFAHKKKALNFRDMANTYFVMFGRK